MNKVVMMTLVAFLMAANAGQAREYPFDENSWEINAREAEIVEYLGERSMKIKGGYATIPDLALTDGIIEFDIAVSPERGFAGAIFRVQDLANYEHFYIRPHQSGNPDANQYNPVFNGVSAWQLYHGEGYGVPVNYTFNEWMHIRIAFAGDQAEVFIDSDTPQLIIPDLKRVRAEGGVGFGAGNFAAAHFANFAVKPLPDGYQFAKKEIAATEPADGMIMSWEVSQPFAEADTDTYLTSEQVWSPLAAEATGITNLAQIPGAGGENKTVIARLKLVADKAQHAALDFGYSDSVTVYVNGAPVYGGSNAYESRDYRYLGTIGLFDRVYLPLEEGENEVWFVVTETFGGWGVMARLEDVTGITIL